MGQFFKILPNLGQNWLKFKKILEKLVILFKIWSKIGPIGIWMGYFFLKNWYLYGSTFKFHGGTSLPKPNLSTRGGGGGGRSGKKCLFPGKLANFPTIIMCLYVQNKKKIPSNFQNFPLNINISLACASQIPHFSHHGGGGHRW